MSLPDVAVHVGPWAFVFDRPAESVHCTTELRIVQGEHRDCASIAAMLAQTLPVRQDS